jgi:hypothetical protein
MARAVGKTAVAARVVAPAARRTAPDCTRTAIRDGPAWNIAQRNRPATLPAAGPAFMQPERSTPDQALTFA